MTTTNHTTQSNPYLPDRDSKASSEDFMKRKRMEHLFEVFKTMDLNLPRALMVKRYNISDHDSFGFIKLAAVVRDELSRFSRRPFRLSHAASVGSSRPA